MKVSGNSGQDFKHPEPGLFAAVCTRVIDLGTQETSYQGKPKKARKVMLGWEIDQLMEDGRPFLVVARYTASIHVKSTLGKLLESWRGRAFSDEEREGFDLTKILGAVCMLNLVKEGDYTNVAAASPMPKGLPRIAPAGPLIHFDLDNFSNDVFMSLSENLRATISKSPEYRKAVSGKAEPEHHDEPAPGTDDGTWPPF